MTERLRMYFNGVFKRTPFSRDYSPVKIMYHGLWNQGSTCYLNCVLQVLFMTKEFRQNLKVTRCRDEHPNILDHELTKLFGELEKRTSNTFDITRKLDIRNTWEQRDAAEYFERILRLTSEEASKVFHGELINRNTCSMCETHTDISAAFWYLPLALADSCSDYSVLKGVEDMFRTSELNGENQMYCERCDKKSDATITCMVVRHPEVLVLLLKRFDFDIHCRSYVKLACAVDVPLKLQIPKDQTYELFAFVDHFGSLRSGHYRTTIQSQDDGKWYLFDDHRVSLDYQWFQIDTNEKLHNAYLLFYRKVVPADTSSQNVDGVSTPGVQQDQVRMQRDDGQGTEDASIRDVGVNAAASVSSKVVLQRPMALSDPLSNLDDEGDDEGDIKQTKPRHHLDTNEDNDREYACTKKQKEVNDEKYRTVNDQRRMEAAEGVKNYVLDWQHPLYKPHNSTQYVPENQTIWGKQDDVRNKMWIEMEERGRSEPEQQKNEEFHRVPDQNRQTFVPDRVNVQRPRKNEETDSERNFAGRSPAQVERFSHQHELNQEVTWKREGNFGVSGPILRHSHELRSREVNRDNGDDEDNKMASEKLDDMRENGPDYLKVNKKRIQSTANLTVVNEFIRGDEYIIKYQLSKPKGDELNERKGTEENAMKMDQRRSSERSRTSRGDTNSRSDNLRGNRSSEQHLSATQTAVRKGCSDDRHDTYERPPTDGTTEGKRRVKSETDAQNSSNNHEVRPETQSDAQDVLHRDMRCLSVTDNPPEGIEGLEPKANGQHLTKRKGNGNYFPCCCKIKKAKHIESEDI